MNLHNWLKNEAEKAYVKNLETEQVPITITHKGIYENTSTYSIQLFNVESVIFTHQIPFIHIIDKFINNNINNISPQDLRNIAKTAYVPSDNNFDDIIDKMIKRARNGFFFITIVDSNIDEELPNTISILNDMGYIITKDDGFINIRWEKIEKSWF